MFNRKINNKRLDLQIYSQMYVYWSAFRDYLRAICEGLLSWIQAFMSSDSAQKSLKFSNRTVLYRRQEVLGEGAYGTVVRGQDRLSSKKYAIKIMNCLNYDVELVIKNELDSLNRFKHKNIIELIDSHSSVDNGAKVVYLLFPLCSGGSLRTYLNRTLEDNQAKYSLKNTLGDFCKICSAINLMHDFSPSYIHQDIKPDNILIQDGIPMLTDFGSVRLSHRDVNTRQQALAVIDEAAQFCTMPYRSPELFDPPRGVSLDCRTDVWAIGCLLFAWWFGYSPFECEFAVSESKFCKYTVKLTECSQSRVLAKIPRPSGSKELNVDDNIVCDLTEWILDKNMTTRPFISDILTRVGEAMQNLESNNRNSGNAV